jgi:anaerobic ribonucleoside-triphosphate reductase activating protein
MGKRSIKKTGGSCMKFQYAGYIPNSMENGEGIRDVIFFSGCDHVCEDCHNKELWNFNFGDEIDTEEVVRLVLDNKQMIDGVTMSGGDPFYQPKALLEICKRLKQEGLNIWAYTGFTADELLTSDNGLLYQEIFDNIDVLIDGKYMKDLPPAKFRGSANQRIIHFENGIISKVE